MRIVSLLPSATEIVYLLGLGEELTGVSHECDYPPAALGKLKIIKPAIAGAGLSSREIDRRVRTLLRGGDGIYQIDLEALRRADPDLVLTQELCEVCAAPYQEVLAAVKKLRRKPEVLSLNPRRLADVLKDIERIGEATGRLKEGAGAVAALRERVERIERQTTRAITRPTVVCLEWLDPLMASGHWIPEMVALAGGIDPLGIPGVRSRQVEWEVVRSSAPEIIILMPCGFSVERCLAEFHLLARLPGWDTLPAVQARKVFAVNGHAYYSRSGPRLVDGLEILARLVHPDVFPGRVPEKAAKPVVR